MEAPGSYAHDAADYSQGSGTWKLVTRCTFPGGYILLNTLHPGPIWHTLYVVLHTHKNIG